MKLGELKSAIRSHKGAPQVYVQLGAADKVLVTAQKTSLLKAIDEAHGDVGRNGETGLILTEDGIVLPDTFAAPASSGTAAPAVQDLDDLGDLGSDVQDLDDLDDLGAAPVAAEPPELDEL